jgi:hypothetical protein
VAAPPSKPQITRVELVMSQSPERESVESFLARKDLLNGREGSGLVERLLVTSTVMNARAAGWLAPAFYWLCVLAAPVPVCFGVYAVIQRHDLAPAVIVVPITLAVAALIYGWGYGSRWLWTGRTEHLFAPRRVTPPGALEDFRLTCAAALAFWTLF